MEVRSTCIFYDLPCDVAGDRGTWRFDVRLVHGWHTRSVLRLAIFVLQLPQHTFSDFADAVRVFERRNARDEGGN